jgi:predicted transcriptional regulator
MDCNTKVKEFMTKFEDLICAGVNTTLKEANDIIWEKKLNCLPIIDDNQRLVVTPEATQKVIEKYVPGIGEVMRMKSLEITPRAMLSRGISGIRGETLIINLPGSPKAAVENLQTVIPALLHGIEILTGRAGECSR